MCARKVVRLDTSFGKYTPDVVAKPVDTYVTPSRATTNVEIFTMPERRPSVSLAESLAGLHKPLTRFLKMKMDEKTENDEAEGKKLYEEQGNRRSWEEFSATDEKIRKNAAIKRGYLAARASNEAMLVESTLRMAYTKGEAVVDINGQKVNVRQTDDPVVFDKWVREFVRGYIEKNMGKDTPPDIFSNIFMPQIEDGVRKLNNYHTTQQQQFLYMKAEAELGELMRNTMEEHIKNGALVSDDNIDGMKNMADDLSRKVQAAIATGLPYEKAVDSVIKMLAAYASDDTIENVEEVLHAAKMVEVAPGVTIGNMPAERLSLEREAEASRRRAEVKRERELRDLKMKQTEKREEVYVDMIQETLKGNIPSKAALSVMVDKLKREGIESGEIAMLMNRIEGIKDYMKPEVDQYAIERARRESQEKNLLYFMASNQNPSIDKIMKAAPLIGYGNAIQLVQRNKSDREAFGDVKSSFGKYVLDGIQIYGFGRGKEITSKKEYMDKARVIENAVWSDYKRVVKKNPEIQYDITETQRILDDSIRSRSREWAGVNEMEISKTLNKQQGYEISKESKEYRRLQVFYTNNNTREAWKTQADEYNNYVSRGGDPGGHPLMKALKQRGITPVEFERETGVKLQIQKIVKPVAKPKSKLEWLFGNKGGRPD